MANRSLGSLTIDLIAKIGGWTDGLNKAERELDKRTKRMNKMANDFGRSLGASLKSAVGGFLAFAGVSVSIGAVAESLKGAIDRADELRDASIRLGVGVDVLSKWSYAAKQTGTDIDSLQKGLKILSKNAAEALDPKSKQAGLFDALGVSKDKLSDLNKLVPALADAFQRLPDGIQKAAVAQELFGKSGLELTEFLNQGSKGLDEFGDKLERLGGVVTPEVAAQADEFKDKLDDLKTQLGGASMVLAAELLPKLIELIDSLGVASDKSSALGKAISFLSNEIEADISGFTNIVHIIEDIGTWSSGTSHYVMDLANAVKALLNLDFSEFKANLNKAMADAATARMAGSDALLGRVGKNSVHTTVTDFTPLTQAQIAEQNRVHTTVKNFQPLRNTSDALSKYFASGSGGGASKKSGGKSQAQKDAEALDAAYKRMNESLSEQIALFGKTSETAKERYDLESGELAKLDPQRKAELTAQLDKIDQMKAEKDLQEKLTEKEKERQDQIDRAQESAQQQIEDMQFELSLMGLTNKEREKEIALRYATADATDAQKAKITELSYAMTEGQKQADFWLEFQHDFSDMLYNVVTGAESAKDAVKGFFDSIAQYITRMIADNWAEKIASLFQSGSGSSGGGGGFWSGLLGALFSGGDSSFGSGPEGFASGGYTGDGPMNQVAGVVHRGEYVIPSNVVRDIRSGRGGMAMGGPVAVNQQFVVQGRMDSRTAAQMAQQAASEGRRALARNG